MQRKSTTLVALVAVLGALVLLVMWYSLERRTDCVLDVDPPAPVVAGVREPAPSEGAAAPAARVAQAPDEAPPADAPREPRAPAHLRGRVTLDGAPLEGGWVQLRSAQGEWQSRAVIDYEGRFLATDVPDEAVLLSFELRPAAEPPARTLCLPTLELAPRAAPAEELALAWRSRQINVRVVDAERNGCAATLALEGRGYDASADTDDEGLARLAVIGGGRFQLHAVTRAGARGEAEVELAEGEDLASAVIVVGVDR